MGVFSDRFVTFVLTLVCAVIAPIPSFAWCSPAATDAIVSKKHVVVGFMQTKKETYPEELTFSHNIYDLLTGLGAHVVRIDYNDMLDFDEIKSIALEEVNGDMAQLHDVESRIIREGVMSFLRANKITRIFIPGNYYNVDTEPYSPTPNRQLITTAIAEIIQDNPDIKIMGVCGGLQGIMHALGIKVVRVQHILGSHESANSHFVSMPDPHKKDTVLHRLRIVPGSRLASIVSKHVDPDANQWYSLFFPDAHGGVVSNDPENMKKLEELGYKIVGFSDDGIIEALEDKYGNILFQDHPEALAINFLRGHLHPAQDEKEKPNVLSKDKLRYQAALSAISIIEDFLHRE